MNIICYVNKLSGGGAERVMSVLANGMSRLGHNVILVTDYSTPGEYPVDTEVKRIVLDGEFTGITTKGMLRRTWRRLTDLNKLCRENSTDVLVSFMKDGNFRALLATRFTKTANLISVRIDPKIGYRDKKSAMIAKTIYRWAGGCVFQTAEAQAWFPERIQRKSRVILNPISDVFYQTKGQPTKEKRIVCCGRLEKQKNFALLIAAFDKIADRYPEYQLDIYGVGSLCEELQKQIDGLGRSEQICLRGTCENVPETIKNASLFVLSSDYEGLPNALMEAMALGLPVVSTDCGGGGARALIEHGVNGLMVPCNDVDAMAEAIEQNLAHPEAAKLRGERAAQTAKQFSVENIVTLWERYISEIAEDAI